MSKEPCLEVSGNTIVVTGTSNFALRCPEMEPFGFAIASVEKSKEGHVVVTLQATRDPEDCDANWDYDEKETAI